LNEAFSGCFGVGNLALCLSRNTLQATGVVRFGGKCLSRPFL
jgi:hypothetical protein